MRAPRIVQAVRQEGWRRGLRWIAWGRFRRVRCPYCAGADARDWLAMCDCFRAEDAEREGRL